MTPTNDLLEARMRRIEQENTHMKVRYERAQNRFRVQAAIAVLMVAVALFLGSANHHAIAQSSGPTLSQLAAEIAALQAKTTGLAYNAATSTTLVTGNLQVVNGAGSTATANSLGNLIIGYGEGAGTYARNGSHNLIVGPYHTYSSYGGIVAGYGNSITGAYSSVTGGGDNKASGIEAWVGGGYGNTASGNASSVSGGQGNAATGPWASVLGGLGNTASASVTSIGGGYQNSAINTGATCYGGESNISGGQYSSVLGGTRCNAAGTCSSLVGGYQRYLSGGDETLIGPDTFGP